MTRTAKLMVIGWIGLGSLSPLLLGQAGQKVEALERTKFSSLQKSLIVPGWGQFSEKRYFEGGFFLTLEICYLFEVFRNNRKGNRYYRSYKSAGSADVAVLYRSLAEHFDKRRNYWMVLSAGVWAVNLVDMYVIVKKKGKAGGRLGIRANVSQEQGLSLQYRFSF